MRLAGIDIGTTSISAVVFEPETATVVQTITIPNQRHLPSQFAYEHLQDADGIVADVLRLVQQLTEGRQLAGISVTGQMHGIVYVDANGLAVSPLYTWQDKRGDLTMGSASDADADTYAGAADGSAAPTYAEWLSSQSGHRMAAGYGIATHFWLQQNQQLPAHATKFCTIVDYVGMRLVNRRDPATDTTNGASLGCFDIHSGAFDAQALRRCGIESSWLPEVVPQGTLLGVHGQTPVYNGIGDNQASFLGSVQAPAASLLVNVGTGAQIVLYDAGNIAFSTSEWESRPYMDGGCLHVGATLAGGQSYAMLEQFFRDVCRELGLGSDDNLYARMEALVADSLNDADADRGASQAKLDAGMANLRVNPQFAGTRTRPSQRGSIANISLDNFTPASLVEGFLRGMVCELTKFLDDLPSDRVASIQKVVGSGNAIRKNNALQRILSAEFGRPLVTIPYTEEAALGAALHAAVCCGAYDSYDTAAAAVHRNIPQASPFLQGNQTPARNS